MVENGKVWRWVWGPGVVKARNVDMRSRVGRLVYEYVEICFFKAVHSVKQAHCKKRCSFSKLSAPIAFVNYPRFLHKEKKQKKKSHRIADQSARYTPIHLSPPQHSGLWSMKLGFSTAQGRVPCSRQDASASCDRVASLPRWLLWGGGGEAWFLGRFLSSFNPACEDLSGEVWMGLWGV